MPNFTIRRKKKKVVEPAPEILPEPAPTEVSESEDFDSAEDRYIDDVLDEAKEEIEPQRPVRQPRYEPQRRVHFQEPVNPARRPPMPVQQYRKPAPLSHLADPYRREPTMACAPRERPRGRGRQKFRYSTHYGIDGDVLDTRAKASMLYTHCFG